MLTDAFNAFFCMIQPILSENDDGGHARYDFVFFEARQQGISRWQSTGSARILAFYRLMIFPPWMRSDISMPELINQRKDQMYHVEFFVLLKIFAGELIKVWTMKCFHAQGCPFLRIGKWETMFNPILIATAFDNYNRSIVKQV